MRRRSGRWLRRLAPWRARVRAARPPWAADFEAVYGQLLQARYGDPLQQSVPVGRSIARARKLLKRCQRLRRNAPASATPPPPEPATAG
jgi:hypothetical protein